MNTLIIGGAGFIGAHLAGLLLDSGRRVTVLGRHAVPLHALPAGTDYVAGDFTDNGLLCKLLESHGEVIHLAYATVPNTSFENPLEDLLQNLPSSVQLFAEIASRGIRLLLVSSGGTVYGDAVQLPITESHPTRPISPYGVSKLTLENYAYLYARTHGLEYVCVRPANAYGEGQRPFIGQGFISTAMATAMLGKPVQVFGQHGVIRDYIHVTDLAAGIVSAMERGKQAETYNIGTGLGLSNMDVIGLMQPLLREFGCTIQTVHLPERIFDVKANVLDAAKLHEHTGWKAEIAIAEGLLRTRDWLRKSDA